jgi:hypothetical protein
MEKQTKQRITRTLKFTEVTNKHGRFVGGGVTNTIKHVDEETWVEVFAGSALNSTRRKPQRAKRIQLHVGGTRRAFEELGVFLLALSRYTPHKTDYSVSFDLKDSEDQPVLHFVIHLPVDHLEEKAGFQRIHTVAIAQISEDGKQIIDTTVGQEPESKGKDSYE